MSSLNAHRRANGGGCFGRRSLCFAYGLLFLLALAAPDLRAQVSSSSTLKGVIRDPNGAVVPDAAVTLINEKTGTVDRTTKSSDEGVYVFSSINPDTYTVRVEAANFAPTLITGIVVNPSTVRGENVTLAVGASEENVSVSANATEEIKTETGERSNTITAEKIENLSLVGRSSLELLRVLPGVVAPPTETIESVGFNTGANNSAGYNINGLRGQSNNVSIDGSRVVDIGSNSGTIITANNDMVQEVEVKTSNYAAEFGSAGVQISAVTKGGGREFHGSLYDYYRDFRFQANDASRRNFGVERAKSRFHYPGGNLSGPVTIPNFGEGGSVLRRFDKKLFFFFGLEIQQQRVDPGAFPAVVPTLRQRQGDFSEFTSLPGGATFLNQSNTVNAPRGLGALTNGNLTPFADPVGRALLNLFPLPNAVDPNGQFNYVGAVIQPVDRNDVKARFDYKINDNANLYLRLARESETQNSAYGLWWQQSNYELPSNVQGSNLGRSAALGVTNTIGATMTNEVVFSYSKLKLDNDYADPDKVSRSALGIDNFRLPFGAQSPYAPLSIITSWNGSVGGVGNQPGDFSTTNPQVFAYNDSLSITDNFTKVFGTHTVKFGGTFERADKNQNFENPTDGRLITATWGAGSTGNEFADIFAGQPAQFEQGTRIPPGNFRFYNVEAYGQDRWKVRPNITLEYGLRVGYFPNNYERTGLGAIFDPRAYNPNFDAFINPQRLNGLLYAGRGEVPLDLLPDPAPQLAPRLGIAWDIGGKSDFVIRAGGGLFYNRVQGNFQYDILRLAPNSYNINVDAGSGDLPPATPGCESFLCRVGGVNPFTRLAAPAISSQSLTSNRIPRVASFSLSVAKRLPLRNVLEIAYVGTIGRHLPQQRQINVLPPVLSGTLGNADLSNPVHRAALSPDAVVELNRRFRPFPTLGNVRVREFTGTSSYNSLQATLSRQITSRLTYFATYTFSKALGTVAVNETGDEVDPIDTRGRNYGILPFDRTHVFNLSYNFAVPDAARGYLDNFLLRGALNGWQFSGITTYQSGAPLYPQFAGAIVDGNVRRGFFGTDVASGITSGIGLVYLRNPQLGGINPNELLLDPAAFAAPAFGSAGSFQPAFYMRAPARSNFDLSLFKNFGFGENRNLQFRAGFFNIFNQSFANPTQGDVNLTLNTTCNRFIPAGTPTGTGVVSDGGAVGLNRCDPTGGFTVTPGNFGLITNKRGRRIVEFALKFNF